MVLPERPLEESLECNHLFNLCGKVCLVLVSRLFLAAQNWEELGACFGTGLAPGRQLVPRRPPGVRRPLLGDLHFMIFL